MPAYYSSTIPNFLSADVSSIIGELTKNTAHAGYYELKSHQTFAWEEQISVLQNSLEGINGNILFEYPIPRRAKRIDCVLLISGFIIVIEFKLGSKGYLKNDIQQLEDYCLDLRDFHKQSLNRIILPILVASHAKELPIKLYSFTQGDVYDVLFSNGHNLRTIIDAVTNNLSISLEDIDLYEWEHSPYEPTPTIIETAQHLYAGKSVKEISRSHADNDNLLTTSKLIVKIIEKAKRQNEKVICFITGVPGAGKTLAGLNIVHSHDLHEGELGIFLSGNGPLVKVLSEALAKDNNARTGATLKNSRREVSTFIQNVHHFLDTYFDKPDSIPPDNIVIFDEAQRAWNKEQSYKKFRRDFSEPELMLEIMDRHRDWAVIVGLIGGGQEINTGEAGLSEWGRALTEKYPHWRIVISPELKEGHHATGGQCLFEKTPSNITIEENKCLHLNVSLRSYKAEKVSEFVDSFLSINKERATEIINSDLDEYPIVYTRSLDTAKERLRQKQCGTRRFGLIASSGARRLKAYGIDVTNDFDVAKWFLNPADDVRSSYFLENIATEFEIQGLELDWTCVCWGGDLRLTSNSWSYKQFKGSKWQNVNSGLRRQYILNKYRVLLTRAREGMIIWVPDGSTDDPTNLPDTYDGLVTYLKEIGVPSI